MSSPLSDRSTPRRMPWCKATRQWGRTWWRYIRPSAEDGKPSMKRSAAEAVCSPLEFDGPKQRAGDDCMSVEPWMHAVPCQHHRMNMLQDRVKRRLRVHQDRLMRPGQLLYDSAVSIHHRPHRLLLIGFQEVWGHQD